MHAHYHMTVLLTTTCVYVLSVHLSACLPVSQGLPASPTARVAPAGTPTSLSMGRHTQPPGSPPVHDVREILGNRAPVLHVAGKSPVAAVAAAAGAAPAVAPTALPHAQQ